MSRLRITALACAGCGALALSAVAAVGSSDREDRRGDRPHGAASAVLRDADGSRVGHVRMRRLPGGKVAVFAALRGLPSGFHAFHVHETGLCEPPGFTSAGGHFAGEGQQHGEHAGDLPSVYVMDSGRATLAFVTDAFALAELLEGDGSAMMVHAGRDNYANIPTRYHSHVPDESSQTFGPDAETLGAGDAGERLACGVLSR